MSNINLIDICFKWQKARADKQIFKVTEDENKKKFYVLDMFPYPSGSGLHVGHPKGYIATDVVARKKLLEGYNVLHPMGRDAFGLPTENYAIKNKIHPAKATKDNIEKFKSQLFKIGFTYDREREINTTDPKYYKRSQRIFIKLYNHYFDKALNKAMPISNLENNLLSKGKSNEEIKKILDENRLAYVDYKPIIRCPECMTGLAQEDLEDGKCERCSSDIQMKPMRQRVIRITKYADRLLEGLDQLVHRQNSAKEMQRNRIGKSEGTEFEMDIEFENKIQDFKLKTYTTRIDTAYGISFIAISPEHDLVSKITTKDNFDEVNKYIQQAKTKTELQRVGIQKDKTGIFSGSYVINPFNGHKLPIYIADYVLISYGTGVVMGVPAHDQRDYDFAKKYNLEILEVVTKDFEMQEKKDDEINVPGVRGILFDPITQKYGGIKIVSKGRTSNVCGGKQTDESYDECIHREVLEETGYNIQKIIPLSQMSYSRYHHSLKNDNRRGNFVPYLCIVDSSIKGKKSFEDHEKSFENSWFNVDVFLKELNSRDINNKVPHFEYRTKRAVHKAIILGYDTTNDVDKYDCGAMLDYGILINSGDFTGLSSSQAIQSMQDYLYQKGIGGKKQNYRLQERVFSRQRYRGEPIPMIHTQDGGVFSISEAELPLELPQVDNYEPTGTQEGPLANINEWIDVELLDGKKGKRESNTMPQRAGSSWYRLRYMDPNNDKMLVSPQKEKYRGQVDLYVGGTEHTTRHLIYARFFNLFLYDIGVVSVKEPFKKLRNLGMILAEDGRKMSKRRGNVINPDDIILEFGADVLRVYEMFIGPFDQDASRSTSGVRGIKKFLDKIVNLLDNIVDEESKNHNLDSSLHKTIKKVTEDIEGFKFNTAISQMMIFINQATDIGSISKSQLEKFCIILSPFAPHLTEEIWSLLGNKDFIIKTNWPNYDPNLILENEVLLPVQINGKMRGTILINKDLSQDDVLETILKDKKLSNYYRGKSKKIVFIQNKIINIII